MDTKEDIIDIFAKDIADSRRKDSIDAITDIITKKDDVKAADPSDAKIDDSKKDDSK